MYKLRNKGESFLSISRFLNRNNHITKMGKKFTKDNLRILMKTDRDSISTQV